LRGEIIAIGDELTSGARLDTNSQWLSQQLTDLGIRVIAHTTIADDLPAMIQAIQVASDRADFVICSGGLGPTADDLTRDAFAQSAGVSLELDPAALKHLRLLFRVRKREMPKQNEIQAYFPAGSQVIPNPHGSAPGFEIAIGDPVPARFFALPGVPAELFEMFLQTVRPRLELLIGRNRKWIQHRVLKCFGVGESELESMLPDLIRRGRTPTVGITVSRATITLRISAEAAAAQESQRLIDETEQIIRGCLGDLVFGEEADELQHVVFRRIAALNGTLSVAEVGTGGLLCDWFSQADENRDCFRGGLVRLQRADAAQPFETAGLQEFAAETARVLRTDYCLAIGAFPQANTNPPGEVQIGFLTPRRFAVTTKSFAGHPDILRHRAAKQALDFARLQLAAE
jgi:nicotinamide-nucleotide amidase